MQFSIGKQQYLTSPELQAGQDKYSHLAEPLISPLDRGSYHPRGARTVKNRYLVMCHPSHLRASGSSPPTTPLPLLAPYLAGVESIPARCLIARIQVSMSLPTTTHIKPTDPSVVRNETLSCTPTYIMHRLTLLLQGPAAESEDLQDPPRRSGSHPI